MLIRFYVKSTEGLLHGLRCSSSSHRRLGHHGVQGQEAKPRLLAPRAQRRSITGIMEWPCVNIEMSIYPFEIIILGTKQCYVGRAVDL